MYVDEIELVTCVTESKSISVPGGYESGGWADFDEKYGLKAYVLKVIVSPLLMIFKVHN